MQMSKVLIIVVSYNGVAHLPNCLFPLRQHSDNLKFLVVDNGSTDGTPEIIKQDYPFVELIETGKNLGFGAANNIGLKKAIDEGYDYVYLLNQDAWIEPEDILKLIEIAERNPEYGIITPMQVYAGKKKIDNSFSGKVTKEIIEDFIIPGNNRKEIYRVKNRGIQAAHWLVRCSAIKKAGGFSPTFFHYGEDDNLCRRMEFHGFKLGLVPNILAVHNREDRKLTSAHQLLLRKNELKKIASDPLLSYKAVCKSLLSVMFLLFIDYKFRFFPIVFEFIKSYPQIRKNRKDSINQSCAFLR